MKVIDSIEGIIHAIDEKENLAYVYFKEGEKTFENKIDLNKIPFKCRFKYAEIRVISQEYKSEGKTQHTYKIEPQPQELPPFRQ